MYSTPLRNKSQAETEIAGNVRDVTCHVEKSSQLQSGTLDPRKKTLSFLSSYIEAQSV